MQIYGKQPIYYYIEKHPQKIKKLYLAKDLDKKEYSRLMRMGFEIKRIPHEAGQKMVKNANHQGFIAEVEGIEIYPLSEFKNNAFTLILSGVTDVGNIGALIRSAYALGIDGVVICGIKHLNVENIVRTSVGAAVDMKIAVINNVLDVMNELSMYGISIYGATLDGEDIRDIEAFAPERALILGSEGEGLSNKIVSRLDYPVKIAMENDFDSLNVSVAGAILMDRMR